MTAIEKVDLIGTERTALIGLYGKALDSRRPDSILSDREADQALQRMDCDFAALRMRPRDQESAALRAKAYDRWVKRFLDVHPECVVLHLGCGLDTRVYRVNPPPTVDWYDIDLPDVIGLRRRLFPPRSGLHTIAASVTDPRLLDTIPGDKPILVIAEGLTPYLRAADGVAMLRRITEHFPSGELLFDGYSPAGVWGLQRYAPVKASGAQLDWSINDPHELERTAPRLVFDSESWYWDPVEIKRHYSWLYRQFMPILFHIPPIRRLGRGLRYHFGTPMPSGHDHSTERRALLWCGAIGAPVFVVAFLLQDAVPVIRPAGYNPLRHPVSSLAIGPSGWIQVANFLIAGVLLLAFAVGLRPALRRYNCGIWAPVLVGLIAIGLIGAGLFTADPLSSYPQGTPAVPAGAARTTHGVLHEAFSALVFLGVPAACSVLGYRFARSGRRWWACYSIGTAVVFLTGFVLADMGFAQHPTFVSIGGLLQRLTLIAGLAWLSALALHLIRRGVYADQHDQ